MKNLEILMEHKDQLEGSRILAFGFHNVEKGFATPRFTVETKDGQRLMLIVSADEELSEAGFLSVVELGTSQ